MAELPGPLELLDLQDKESATFKVVRFLEGTAKIKTDDVPEGKEVAILRVHLVPGTKTIGLNYWDISSKTLQAQLVPFLKDPAQRQRTFKVTAHGVRPRKRFTLEVSG